MKIVYVTLKPEVYSARRISEVASARGHELLCARPDEFQLSIGGPGAAIFHRGKPCTDVDAVLSRFGPTEKEHGFAVLRQFELNGAVTINPAGPLVVARDKLHAFQRLSKADLPLPRTLLVRTSKEFRQLSDQLPGDKYIIKLPVGVQGIGVMLAESSAAAESILDTMWGLRNTVLVQEYLSSAAKEDKRLFVIGGKVVAGMTRSAPEGDFRSNLHRGGKGTRTEISEDDATVAERATGVLGLEIAGVDLASSERGPVILEVNASPGMEGLEEVTGIDIAEQVVRHLEALRDSCKGQ